MPTNKYMGNEAKPKRVHPASFAVRPDLQKRAKEAARGVKRPGRKGKLAIITEARVRLAMNVLVKEGYEEKIREHLGGVLKAHFSVAQKAKVGATAERKLFFQAAGLIGGDKEPEANTIGDILARIFSKATPVEEQNESGL